MPRVITLFSLLDSFQLHAAETDSKHVGLRGGGIVRRRRRRRRWRTLTAYRAAYLACVCTDYICSVPLARLFWG